MTIKNLRIKLIDSLLQTDKPLKLNKIFTFKELRGINKEKIIFDNIEGRRVMIKELLDERKLYEKIDYGNISFNNVDLTVIKDFRNLINLNINPQKVFNKNLSFCLFKDVNFKDNFNECNIEGMKK